MNALAGEAARCLEHTLGIAKLFVQHGNRLFIKGRQHRRGQRRHFLLDEINHESIWIIERSDPFEAGIGAHKLLPSPLVVKGILEGVKRTSATCA